MHVAPSVVRTTSSSVETGWARARKRASDIRPTVELEGMLAPNAGTLYAGRSCTLAGRVRWPVVHVAGRTAKLAWISLIKLRKQCRLLVPFLFGEANPNPNLKPTWLAIMASRARPDEPEVSRWRAGGGVW